jgi:hypothetical protein
MTKIIAPVILLVICAAVFADMPAVSVKLADAKVAAAAGKAKEASAALASVADIVKADAAGAGEYAQSFAKRVAETATRASAAVEKTGKLNPEILDALSLRTADLYEAIIPAGKGDFAAIAAYLRKLVKSAPESSAKDLEAAAKALDGSSASEAARKPALSRLYVTLGALVPMDRVAILVSDRKAPAAAVWLESAIGYLEHEARVSDDKRAEQINYIVADAKGLVDDLQTGLDSFDVGQMQSMREEILTLMTSAPAPGPAGVKK